MTVLRHRPPRFAACALLLSFVAACATTTPGPKAPSKSDSASTFNTQLGIEYLKKGDLPTAKEKLERAEQENPRDPNVHVALALLNERLNLPEKVDDEYRTALRLAPKNPDISNNYAVFLCRSKRYDEGVKRFMESANNALYQTPEAAYTNAGVCLRAADRQDDAWKSFRRALQIRPNFSEAAYQLSDLELARGQTKEARAHLDEYLGAFNATPDLLLLGVRIARAGGDRVATERYARLLRNEFPESEQTRELADVLRAPNPG